MYLPFVFEEVPNLIMVKSYISHELTKGCPSPQARTEVDEDANLGLAR